MNSSSRTYIFNWLVVLLIGFAMGGCAQTQVTNNSGSLIDTVEVGSVKFSEYLDYCGDGCSTGFKRVKKGDHKISLRETAISPWITIGTVGPFKKFKFYSVNVRKEYDVGPRKKYCAELWQRFDTDLEFNSDTSKRLVVSLCPKDSPLPHGGGRPEPHPPSDTWGPESMVTNSSETLIHKVKISKGITDVEYTENLNFCSSGCSTGYKPVALGHNQIILQVTEGSDWQTLSAPLGPFEIEHHYSVNVTAGSGGGFCAELWKIANTGLTFNEAVESGNAEEMDSHCFQ